MERWGVAGLYVQTSETKQGLRLEQLGNWKLSLHFRANDCLQEMSSKQLGTIGRVSTESDSPTDLKAIFILHIRIEDMKAMNE